jgi:hypothetical protein
MALGLGLLGGCTAAAAETETERGARAAEALVAPAVCADLMGSWTGDLSNASATTALGPVPLTASVSVTFSQGMTPDALQADGNVTTTVPILGAVMQPFSGAVAGFASACGQIHQDTTQTVMGVGDVHLVIDGSVTPGAPTTASFTFSVDTPANPSFSATGTLNLTKQ